MRERESDSQCAVVRRCRPPGHFHVTNGSLAQEVEKGAVCILGHLRRVGRGVQNSEEVQATNSIPTQLFPKNLTPYIPVSPVEAAQEPWSRCTNLNFQTSFCSV